MSKDWVRALRFAALPSAAQVIFERTVSQGDGGRSVHYRLVSVSEHGQPIGDGRDYHQLKAVMTPLERLASTAPASPFKIVLDLASGQLTGLPDTPGAE
ncbi:MAG: hypothetical protein AAF437_03415 [Pseudomonadota bacterium]